MGENICKQCYRQGINFQNIQTAYTAQYHPSQKRRLNIANYERNANKNYNEVSSATSQDGQHQKHLEKLNAGESVEKREFSYSVGRNSNWHSHYGEQCGDSLKNWTELPYDPAIPLLGIHPKHTRIESDTCTPMFIAPLFTIARARKHPRCPSADEWILNT